MIPPKPRGREGRASFLRLLWLFRADMLSALPERLFRARMAEFRTPFWRSFLVNEPALVRLVLDERPADFPKSGRMGAGLRPLLGDSVFLSNGATWEHQRRIIDPAFEGGRIRAAFPEMWAAAEAAARRLPLGLVEVEAQASHATADVIFRTLFSLPIEDRAAAEVFRAFQGHQRTQPLVNLAAFVPLPAWMPRHFTPRTRGTARAIRAMIARLTDGRRAAIDAGTAPDDLATKIMTTADPETGALFTREEVIDQVAVFFLAGHETSASAVAWALWLLAAHPEWQERAAGEAQGAEPDLGAIGRLRILRDTFREALRLYPPVPMMVREAAQPETFRERPVRPGDQVVVSPWHLHRHERLWERPEDFDPGRWSTDEGRASARDAFIPFSRGARVCPGAGFAMAEGVTLLAHLLRAYRFEVVPDRIPVPIAHLTIRGRDGIWLRVSAR